ncbi:MAG: mucoidy inhibitor MuiA family protein [Thermoflexales bacterium]|nr:mucoidy inhibitor MuiA family protein [Thermoflexales bacterium]
MTSLDTVIAEVVVFADRARVIRRGSLALETGVHSIEVANLPLVLQPDSVRAAGGGTARAALLGVEVRHMFFSETPVAEVQALELQIEALTTQDKALADQAEAATVRAGFARGLSDKATEQLARGLAFGRAEIDRGAVLIDFVQQQLSQAQSTLRDLAIQRQTLQRQLTKLNNDLQSKRSAQPRERYSAFIEVEVTQPGELNIQLTYMVALARWAALYDLRFEETAEPMVQVGYLGQVTQSTGEDWLNVALTLSTARPALVTVKPELTPWYVQEVPPPPMMQLARGKAMFAAGAPAPAPAVRADMMAGAIPDAEPQSFQALDVPEAMVESRGATVTFKLAQVVSVPSDNSPHKVNIAAISLPPKLDYLSVPKLAEAVYRRATLTNRSEYLLLPGQANLFVDGDFVGTLTLDRVAPNEEFDLTLGVDERVVVTRELKAREVDKKIIGDRRRIRVAYEIEVRNLRDRAIDLEVRDQLPVSRHEQIKVKLEAADPKPIEQTELNELIWKLSPAANAKQLCRFDFTIEHPALMQVIGLP